METIEIPEHIAKILHAIAKEKGITFDELILRFIRFGIQAHEIYHTGSPLIVLNELTEEELEI